MMPAEWTAERGGKVSFDKSANPQKCLAGAGGFEPPNAGTKNRCLTNLAIFQYLL